jgi:magnesium chelatase accessory protein
MARGLDWERDGRGWPHHERSRFVTAGGLRWHLQQWPGPQPGAPQLLLLHGTGASTHSWRGLAPLLAQRLGVVAVDLPGHGFSAAAPAGSAGMRGMAAGITALLRAIDIAPLCIVGHSAGAAIAVTMALAAVAGAPGGPATIIGLNAALLPLRGLAGSIFSPAAKLLALNPLVPHFFAWHATDRMVLQRLLASTGSRLDDEGVVLYRRLIGSPAHVAGALAMMAQWDLPALALELPRLRTTLHLVVAANDGTIPPADASRVQALVPGTRTTVLAGLGHLAHEERPQQIAELIGALVPG